MRANCRMSSQRSSLLVTNICSHRMDCMPSSGPTAPLRASPGALPGDRPPRFRRLLRRRGGEPDPALRGKPVIVGGGERGVVATANYVARRYGVHSAMPLRTARRLCPHGVYLPGHHRLYREYSRRLMAMLDEYSPLVEQMSLDEAYVDLTGTEQLFGPVIRTARPIQRRVADELELSISVGVATNKLVAKVASDYQKPAGFTVVRPGGGGVVPGAPAGGAAARGGSGPAGAAARPGGGHRGRSGPGAAAPAAALVRGVGRAAGSSRPGRGSRGG